jgi:hypothetical protein
VSDDYKGKDIKWILSVPWIGPVEVQLNSLDFSNKDRWQASQDVDHVQHFVDMLKDGDQLKPIILANNPSTDAAMIIVDGHHRALAYLQLNLPPIAYVGQIGSDIGDWTDMHDSQKGGSSKQKSSQQSSQQSGQRSLQRSK